MSFTAPNFIQIERKVSKARGKNIICVCNGSMVSTLAILANFCILSHETFPTWIYTELSKEI
jgi:hypothetical protein